MLTNNYREAFKRLIGYVNNITVPVTLTNPSGSVYTNSNLDYQTWSSTSYMGSFTGLLDLKTACTSYYDSGVVFGNGTIEPKPEDYKLSGSLISNFSASASLTISEDLPTEVTATYTITNNGTTEFTISEIGLLGHGRSTGSAGLYFLLDHTLLDSPVTIPAGGVGQVTYTLTFNIA